MPLYPYRCKQCGHRFEKIQSFSSEPEKVCPKCGGVLERLLTAPGLQFKGAGWYVNDYASKGSSSSGSSSGDSASADKKTESATEKKADSASASNAGSTPAAPAAPTPASTTKTS